MRSLSILGSKLWVFEGTESAVISKLAFDSSREVLFALQETQNYEGDTDIEVSRISLTDGSDLKHNGLTIFTVPSKPSFSNAQVLSFQYLEETETLTTVTCGGDLGTVAVGEDANPQFDVVGSVEAGIKYAGWSPDQSLLSIITGEDKLVLMTSTFDVLADNYLGANEKGEDQPVNVGWGSKQTQFHGSLGKTAAQTPNVPPNSVGASPDDDGVPRISWRGDSAYFVVSVLDNSDSRKRRTLRVYDRKGILQTTSEPVAGLEHTLCWRPSGNLIASTQRFGFDGGGSGKSERHDVVFFERNGLRHGDFGLRERSVLAANLKWGYRVKELLWNSDSNILAIWIERKDYDLVQLWTINNYHWYLKQEIKAISVSDSAARFISVIWHPEVAGKLYLVGKKTIREHHFIWEAHASLLGPPSDTGLVAVVDGSELLLTPFRTQNIPPPMCTHRLSVDYSSSNVQARIPVHVSMSQSEDVLGVLFDDGSVTLWSLHCRLLPGQQKTIDPEVLLSNIDATSKAAAFRQLHISTTQDDSRRISILSSPVAADEVSYADFNDGQWTNRRTITLPSSGGRLAKSSHDIIWQSKEGTLHEVRAEEPDHAVYSVAQFPTFCGNTIAIGLGEGRVLFIGLADNGRLYATSSGTSSLLQLAQNCNSFTVASGFVIYTTTSHEVLFALTSVVNDILSSGDVERISSQQWEKRSVERGSRIVTAIPSTMALVLQMPRGNLETIYPRPLVISVVRNDLDVNEYEKAFMACRRHRIDLKIMIEHNEELFYANLSSFVLQLSNVEHFNLFLTSIGQSNLPSATVTKFCDAIRQQLEDGDLTKYIHSILTAYVVKTPPDYEAAMSLLLRLRDKYIDLVEDAVKYIIFLVDADKLFDIALGMYDFSLVLLIAQYSQRDPREYLPFLRELRSLPKYYQRFKIDDHLKRHRSALRNISLAGPEYLDEALKYVEKVNLYDEALEIWEFGSPVRKRVMDIYGDYLFERREYNQAAIAFVNAGRTPKAMIAYEKALMWRELFSVSADQLLSSEEISEISNRVAEELSSKERHLEASQVLIDYAEDVPQAVSVLASGGHFSEARRLISLYSLSDMIEEVLYPASLDRRTQLSEDIDEMRAQLHKQVDRLNELRTKKALEPAAFYDVEDSALQNVDVMTDISMAPTAFTRYTVAPSHLSKSSKRSSRSKRKNERKNESGRKGTADEEEYLLRSLEKLVARFNALQEIAMDLLSHLIQFSAEHRAEAQSFAKEVITFRKELVEAIEKLWRENSHFEDSDLVDDLANPWAYRIQEEKRRRDYVIGKIMKPEVKDFKWRFTS